MACNTVVVVSPGRGRSAAEEPVDIFGRDLGPDRRAQVVEAVGCQVVVEVAVTRRERQHLDAALAASSTWVATALSPAASVSRAT